MATELEKLHNILKANERSAKEKKFLYILMGGIDHQSREKDYQAKLQWLSAQGKGSEMKALREARSKNR